MASASEDEGPWRLHRASRTLSLTRDVGPDPCRCVMDTTAGAGNNPRRRCRVYIGLGTVVLIIFIVLLFMMLGRRT